MRSYPKLLRKTLDAVSDFCLAVEKLREEDRDEFGQLQMLAAPTRLLYAKIDSVGNVGSGEDDLMTYAVPAGILSKDGYTLVIEGTLTTAANANNKRLRIYLGATAIYDSTALALNNKTIHFRATIIRTGSAAERCTVEVRSNDNTLLPATVTYTEAAVSLMAPVTFKATGQATANNDIVQKVLLARWHPANIEA